MIVNVSNKTDLKVGNVYLLLKQNHAIINNATYYLCDDLSFYGKTHGRISSDCPMYYYDLLGIRKVVSFGPSKNGMAQRVVLSKDLYPNLR